MPSEKKVALITGASSGMGAAFTRDLVQKGWNVAMVDVKPSPELQAEVGDAATFFTGDVSDYDSQAKCFQSAWDVYGRLDLVCLNAGIIDRRNSTAIPPKPDLKCTDVNVKGVYYGTQLAIHFMRQNTSQSTNKNIVVTASASSLYPHECYPEYSGSKAAVWNFVRASARVLKIHDNIRINCIRPGFVPTSLAPPAMIEAAKDIITPIGTIVKALNTILDDTSLSGAALECSVDKVLLTPEPEFLNGEFSARASFLWEPGFVAMHGEASQLPESAP